MRKEWAKKRAGIWVGLLMLGCLCGAPGARGQVLALGSGTAAPNPLTDATATPGKALLFDLEARFAKATAEGGGKAFGEWFAEDGVSLGKGHAAVHGHDAIAKQTTWLAKDYQLVWTPTEAVMSPAGDMGYTWGHYEGRSRGADGNTTVTTGRYLTIWRKEKDGSWKVVLDASSDEPAGAGDCCKLPGGR